MLVACGHPNTRSSVRVADFRAGANPGERPGLRFCSPMRRLAARDRQACAKRTHCGALVTTGGGRWWRGTEGDDSRHGGRGGWRGRWPSNRTCVAGSTRSDPDWGRRGQVACRPARLGRGPVDSGARRVACGGTPGRQCLIRRGAGSRAGTRSVLGSAAWIPRQHHSKPAAGKAAPGHRHPAGDVRSGAVPDEGQPSNPAPNSASVVDSGMGAFAVGDGSGPWPDGGLGSGGVVLMPLGTPAKLRVWRRGASR